MEEFNKAGNLYQQMDFPSFDQPAGNAHDDSSLGLMELSLNLRNHLNSLKSIKKNFSRRFDGLLLSSEKKEVGREGINYEQKYEELKKKYEELQEVYNKHVNETMQELQKARQDYERKIKSLKDELDQKNNYIEIIKQGHLQAQEKNNALEARITSLEQLNSTLSLQLKEKAKELSGSMENAGNNVISRSRDLVNMKSDFTRIVDRIGTLEDIIKSLKEAKKQDNQALEELTQKNEELKTENFEIMMENKKLKNEMEDFTTKFSSLDRCFLERKQKTEDFINTLIEYKQSFEIINQVQLDLDNVCEPLKEQNRKLLEEKEKLAEENRQLRLHLKEPIAAAEPGPMEVEDQQGGSNEKGSTKPIGIDENFYFEIMEKLRAFEKEVENKDKEIFNLKNDYDEIKSRNIELETKVIALNRSPSRRANNDQYLSVEPSENFIENSPIIRKNVSQNQSESREEHKEIEKEQPKPIERIVEEAEDERLKIARKPKQIKKQNNAFNPFNAIMICPNCGLIIKKGDKNIQDCSKCHASVHEKCCSEGHKGGDVMCHPCGKKFKKDEDPETDQKDKSEMNE